MECPRCSSRNIAEANFCDACGLRLERRCGACGESNRVAAQFCRNCGAPTTALTAADTPMSAEAGTPSRVFGWAATAASGGERKQVTVLFADTRGSMEMIADRDPEEVRRILDPVLQAMMDGVYQYEGIVSQIMGDGIMALFGAPIAHEDHAIRACHAALAVRRGVALHAIQMKVQYGVDIEVRLGLNSGEVVVRGLQNKFQMEYSAQGRAAHLAARLEQIAKPGTIVISASTLRAASGFIDVKPLGPTPIKGLEEPVPTFELIAARHRRAPGAITATTMAQGQFAGRMAELAALQQVAARAAEGHGQIVSLVGEPGVGKSRLTQEFVRSIQSLGWIEIKTEAISYEKHTAHFSVVALLKAYFDVRITDSAQEVRGKIVARTGVFSAELADTVAAFFWLLDIPVDDAAWNAHDAVTRRRLTVGALKKLLLCESRNQPLLIIFEDLQWIDSESQTILDALVEVIPEARILMLVTYRSGYEHPWSENARYTQLAVDSLAPADVDQVLEGLLGADATLLPLKRALRERTEGNPFFLEECVKSLIEAGAVVGANARYTMAVSSAAFEIPETVHAVLAARIDYLLPEDKVVLQTAAVIGKDVPLLILERITGQHWEQLGASLLRLQRAELIHEKNTTPPEYTFRHALTHDVAYAGLLREQRKRLHAAAVLATEEAYAERIAENVESLARHALAGEVWHKAFHYLRQAGGSAATRSDISAAATWLLSAIDVLPQLPRNDDLTKVAIDVRFELHTAVVASGGHAQVAEILGEAEKLGRVLQDDVRLARIFGYQAMGLWWTGKYADAIRSGTNALHTARRVGNSRMAAIAFVAIGWSHHSRGDWEAADDALTEVLAIARRHPADFGVLLGLPLPQVLACSWLARGRAERGEFAQALEHAGEAVRLAEAADHPWSRAAAYHGLGSTLSLQAKPSEAIGVLERARGICERYEITSWWTAIAAVLGHAYALNKDSAGLPLLEEVARQTVQMGRLAEKSMRISWLAESVLLGGDVVRAAELGREALGLARMHQERPAEAQALFLLGNVSLQAERRHTGSALAFFRQALSVASALSMDPLKQKCRAALGQLSAGHLAPVLERESKAN